MSKDIFEITKDTIQKRYNLIKLAWEYLPDDEKLKELLFKVMPTSFANNYVDAKTTNKLFCELLNSVLLGEFDDVDLEVSND